MFGKRVHNCWCESESGQIAICRGQQGEFCPWLTLSAYPESRQVRFSHLFQVYSYFSGRHNVVFGMLSGFYVLI